MWIRDVLALIGGAVVGIVIYQVLKEAFRAFRQGRRLAYVYARTRGDRRQATTDHVDIQSRHARFLLVL
jgi:uncharacterized membrane-anchored protein YhcB (DUF1043 family)